MSDAGMTWSKFQRNTEKSKKYLIYRCILTGNEV